MAHSITPLFLSNICFYSTILKSTILSNITILITNFITNFVYVFLNGLTVLIHDEVPRVTLWKHVSLSYVHIKACRKNTDS